MDNKTTYLVTGVSRGIGKGLVAFFLARPNSVVVAVVRDPNSSSAQTLSKLPKGQDSSLIVLKIDALVETDPINAIAQLQSSHDIRKLDVVIANAGIMKSNPLAEVPIAEFKELMAVNGIAPFLLFQACFPLLKESSQPKFVIVTAAAGCVAGIQRYANVVQNGAYIASKAVANSLARKIHFENEWLVSFPIHPGWVQSDMGNEGARSAGLPKAMVPIEDCVNGLVTAIEKSSRETAAGPFRDYKGDELPW